MAEGEKGVALAILGIVAVIAVVGLVLLFSQAKTTGELAKLYSGSYGQASGSTRSLMVERYDQASDERGYGYGFDTKQGRVPSTRQSGPANQQPLGLRVGGPDPNENRPAGFRMS